MVDFPKIKADLDDLLRDMTNEYAEIPRWITDDLRRSIDDIANLNCQNCVKNKTCLIRSMLMLEEEDEFGCIEWEGE